MPRTHASLLRRSGAVLAASLAASALGAPFAVHGQAAVVSTACTLYASPSGADTNAGTSALPFRSFQHLANALAPGKVGCLRNGTYPTGGTDVLTKGGTATAPATLRAQPGHTGVLVQGRVVIQPTAHDLVIAGLKLDGMNSAEETSSVTVLAHNVSLIGNDITAPTRICVAVGESSIGQNQSAIITGFLFDGNKVHHCGDGLAFLKNPSPNQEHGLYLQRTSGAVIRYNMFTRSFARGVQLYPDADKTLVHNNVIDENATGVVLGGDPKGVQGISQNNTIRNNIVTSWSYLGIDHNFEEAAAPANGGTHGNVVAANCFFDPGGQEAYFSHKGYSWGVNQELDPLFMNRAAGDYRLKTTSKCIASGLRPTILSRDVRTLARDAATITSHINPHWQTATYDARVRLCGDINCTSVGGWRTSGAANVVANVDTLVERAFTGLLPGRYYQYQFSARQALQPATNTAAVARSATGLFRTKP
jgi:hypothetical protein